MGCGASATPKKEDGAAKKANPAEAGPTTRDQDKKAAKEDNKKYQETMAFLSQVQLLKRLPKDQHPILAGIVTQQSFKAGQEVIRQGEPGDAFFVIKSGEAAVMVAKENGTKVQVAVLKEKDYFGENALLRDEPRTATIIANKDLECLKLTRQGFQDMKLNEKLEFANRKAVGAGKVGSAVAKAPSPKTQEERALIKEALLSNTNLNTMVNLDDSRCQMLIDIAWKEQVTAGVELIVEGDLQADFFYIVQDGLFEIFVMDDAENGETANSAEILLRGESKHVGEVQPGKSFGELALLYLVPRAATVRAKADSTVWVIDRNNFKKILMQVSQEKIKEYVTYINKVDSLQPLLTEEKQAVAEAFIEMHFSKGEVILQQGEPGNTFYILYEGEVSVIQDEQEVNKITASTADCKVFGEKALLNNDVRGATIMVTSEAAKALALDRDSFCTLLGPLEDIINKSSAARVANAGAKKNGKHDTNNSFGKIERRDLGKIGLLGCGGFGTVELYEHKKTGETYALKGLSKGYIVKTGMQESVMNEKNILLMTNSIFIIKLFETYNGTQTLYFLLEPALGGELYATYNRKGLHGSEKHAKFYIAGTVFAFEHCHQRRIIYRDLKPENLLLTEHGRIKLTDMGLAKFVIGKTYTTCGTPDYFAPEIIASTGHTVAVDWWMLGVLTFELLSGHPPFESAYPMQIYSKVMKGINKIPFPAKCQGKVEHLIKGLLKKEPSERLAMRPNGTKNIKEQDWYKEFDWEAMEACTLDPPYKPVVKSKKDIANFSARKEDMPKALEYKEDGTGWDKDFATKNE